MIDVWTVRCAATEAGAKTGVECELHWHALRRCTALTPQQRPTGTTRATTRTLHFDVVPNHQLATSSRPQPALFPQFRWSQHVIRPHTPPGGKPRPGRHVCKVKSVAADSPAFHTGLRVGDIILEVNNTRLGERRSDAPSSVAQRALSTTTGRITLVIRSLTPSEELRLR
jgi:hypothetical protein